MIIKKRNLFIRVMGGILGIVIGLTSFDVNASEITNLNSDDKSSVILISEKESKQFYRTKTGKCYHKGNCKYLKKSKIKIDHEEIEEAGLKSCYKCSDKKEPL